jgi:hypothetical protein
MTRSVASSGTEYPKDKGGSTQMNERKERSNEEEECFYGRRLSIQNITNQIIL